MNLFARPVDTDNRVAFTIRVSPRLHKLLAKEARHQKRSLGAHVEMIIEEHYG